MLPILITSGLTTGALYAMVAIGLVLVYRSTGHINFSHGELFMLGGFFAYSLITYLKFPYPLALVVAVGLSFLLGVVSDRVVYRPLIRAAGLTMVLATVGFSYLLKGIGRYFWGGQGEYLSIPPIVDPAPLFVYGIPILPQQLIVLAAAICFMIAFAIFFSRTRAGKIMQATSENPTASYLVGIRVENVYTWTWGVGAAVAGAAAVLMTPLTMITPDIGATLLIKAFAATILGGLGSMAGAVVGGFLVGLIEQLASGYIDTSLQEIAAFLVIMVVLIFMPNGLFGVYGQRRA
ncbi:MAG: branched-chain amino acid ABC transporter permease [Hyphomicrobiaceae bacterium]